MAFPSPRNGRRTVVVAQLPGKELEHNSPVPVRGRTDQLRRHSWAGSVLPCGASRGTARQPGGSGRPMLTSRRRATGRCSEVAGESSAAARARQAPTRNPALQLLDLVTGFAEAVEDLETM